jgi:hypothetical protein
MFPKKVINIRAKYEYFVIYYMHWQRCSVYVVGLVVMVRGKVIPLHVMEALGVRGGIAPTHS